MKTLKNALAGIFFFAILIGSMLFGGYMDSTYSMDGTIVMWGNEKCVKDAKGEVWSDDRCENFNIGDTVKIVFANNGTHTRYDDVVKKIK